MLQAERVKILRQKIAYNQTMVAEILNTTREAYSNYETGRREPSLEALVLMAKLYHVNIEYLIGECELPYSLNDLDGNRLKLVEAAFQLDDAFIKILLTLIKYKSKDHSEITDGDEPYHSIHCSESD